MKITRENCEAWFLDYYEGRLSTEQTAELFAFLAKHADLQEVFESFEAVSFEPEEEIHFDAKNLLKHSKEELGEVTEENFEEYLAREFEGALTPTEQERLEKFYAKHPEKCRDVELMLQTKLIPDVSIVFENKNALKKTIAITEENFPEYAVDYIEGNLSAEAVAELEKFVTLHPELKAELDLFAKTKVEPEEISFNKSVLYKSPALVNEENFDELAAAYVDGTLNSTEKKALEAFAFANAAKGKTLELYKKTKLAPEQIVFEEKESLKRKARGGYWFLNIQFAAAATVALFIMTAVFLWNYKSNSGGEKGTGTGTPVAYDHHQTNVHPTDTSNSASHAPSATQHNDAQNSSNVADANPKQNQPHNETPVVNPQQVNPQQVTPVVPVKEVFATVDPKQIKHIDNNQNTNDVNFSGSLYDWESNAQPVASNDISFSQYAMRWMKAKLDHHPDGDNDREDDAYAAVDPKKQKQDVTGFDLTSSAVDRLGFATGTNLHLKKEDDGTVLTVGKYHIVLSPKK